MDSLMKNLMETGYTIVTDVEGTIIEVSDSFQDLTGYDAQFLIGKHTNIFNSGYHPKVFFKTMWDTILSGKSWNGVIRNRAKNGNFIWVNTTIFPLKDNNDQIEKFLAFRNDVTHEKEVELKLKESESRLKEAQELTHIGNWEIEFESNKIKWSNEVYRIFGTSTNDDMTFEKFMTFIPDSEQQKVSDAFTTALEERMDYHIVHPIVLPNGEIKTVEENGRTIYNKKGVPIKSFGTVLDITDKIKIKKAEQELKEKNAIINEINHRTKNNIQIVSSILALHALKSKDENVKTAIHEAQDRVNTIAQVHETLYKSSDYGEVNIQTHFTNLFNKLFSIYNKENKDISYSINSEVERMEVKKVVPIALILNELFTNSMKYAFRETNSGEIILTIKKLDDKFELIFADNGKWKSEKSATSGFGTKLIEIFFKQLNGTCKIDKTNGTRYRFTFPI